MEHFIHLLISTVILRPYVFVFFICYLFLAITHIGWKRTILFTMVAYTVAFVSEWSSAVAETGFPFGLYYYTRTTLGQELWVAGVPFMDSLSFTFLSYISWELAVTMLCSIRNQGRYDMQVEEGVKARRSWAAAFLASFLMMCLDIIIDPVTLRGDRWFLGKIYYYPNGGTYFGVTISNFIGWFLVCLIIVRLFVWIEALCFRCEPQNYKYAGAFSFRYKTLGPVGLYFGVMGFNLFITFWINEFILGTIGLLIVISLMVPVTIVLCRGAQTRNVAWFPGYRSPDYQS